MAVEAARAIGTSKARQHHERKRDAIDSEMPVDRPWLVPDGALDELETGDAGFEGRKEIARQSQRRQREGDPDRHVELGPPLRKQPDNDRSHRRQKDQSGQHGDLQTAWWWCVVRGRRQNAPRKTHHCRAKRGSHAPLASIQAITATVPAPKRRP